MANTKISELNSLTGANLRNNDLLPIVDSDANNDGTSGDKETKSITINELKTGIFSSPTFTGNPTALTASAGTNSTIVATTEFVTTALGSFTGVNSSVQNALDTKAPFASPIFTGNPQSSATPGSGNHLANKAYVDSQMQANEYTVLVKKITGAQMSGLTTTSSSWIELIPTPGAGNFIAVREFECYIDRGGSAGSGVAAWKPTVSGQIRGFGDDVQLAFRNTSGQSSFQYNTFGVLQKGILNHLINGVYTEAAANTDIILVRDAPVTQTRAYPNVPLLLKPKTAATTSNFTTYSSTSTHTCNDDYYLRISYRIMNLSSHFTET